MQGMKTIKPILAFLFLLLSLQAYAHPTSFQGATSLMNESSSMARHMMLTYSHRYWLASAAHYTRIELDHQSKAIEASLIGVNTLLKRWNNPTSQGNIYLSAAYGMEFSNGLKKRQITKGDFDIDWEDRRFYIAAGYTRYFRQSESGDLMPAKDLQLKKLRLGVAPYLGEFKELNTWFIVEAMQVQNQTVSITPMFRFYYHNVLWEVGSSLKGDWMFNFMIHYL
jgi:hypothetical protein